MKPNGRRFAAIMFCALGSGGHCLGEAALSELEAKQKLLQAQLAEVKLEIENAKLEKQIAAAKAELAKIDGTAAKEAAKKKQEAKKGSFGPFDPIGFLAPGRREKWENYYDYLDAKAEYETDLAAFEAAGRVGEGDSAGSGTSLTRPVAPELVEEPEGGFFYRAMRREDDDPTKSILSDRFVLSNLLQWDLDWAIGKLGTRIYFDPGEHDEGEIDLFDDGGLQASIEMLTLYAHRPLANTQLDWGPTWSLGIATGSEIEGTDAAVLLMSYGLFLRPREANWQLEFGGMTGISAEEGLDSTTRDDTGIYVGINIGSLFDSAKEKIEKKN